MSGARHGPDSEGPRDFVKYTFYQLRPEWRRLPLDERSRGRAALAELLSHPPAGVRVRTYTLVGLKGDADLLVWSISSELEPITILHAKIAGSPLGGYLDVRHSYLGMGRISEYVGPHAVGGEGSSGRREASGRPYVFVYPFTKKREWYGLPFEERRRIMGEHLRIGHKYPDVEIHTGYSFGLDDAEFILAFEADRGRIPRPRPRPATLRGEPLHAARDPDLHLRPQSSGPRARAGRRDPVKRAPGPASRAAWRRAVRVLPGGVDSPVRSFRAVGGTPVFFARGRGAFLEDVDGRRYLDLVGSWGAALLGHAPPTVVRAVRAASRDGLTFGAPSPREHELAERIRRRCPELERIRFVSSGTEAVMSAVRLARGATGRDLVVKFAGGYHGHSDGLLARAGSGVSTLGLPESAGVPGPVAALTRVVPFNDGEALARLFEREGRRIAAVLVEPVPGNMGVVPPKPGFLRTVGTVAHRHGALVIADEVITGFRLRLGTIHRQLGLDADLVTLAKVIGGGLPVGAYGGRAKLLEQLAPVGPVYQAGTLSGNPVAMAAGAATLDALSARTYRALEHTAAQLEETLRSEAEQERAGPFTVQRAGSMVGTFFTDGPVEDEADASRSDRRRYARYFHAALDGGVYLPPSPLETTFVSAAVRPADLDRTAPVFRRAMRAAANGRRR